MMPLKQWIHEEAGLLRVKPGTIRMRITRGKYDWLPIKRVNQRVLFVETNKMLDWAGEGVI